MIGSAADIAATKFTRRRADGSVVEWQQEDESAVTTKAEAIAMVQRTIDFWLPKLTDDIVIAQGVTRIAAIQVARKSMHAAMADMQASAFAKKWGFTEADFTFDVTD